MSFSTEQGLDENKANSAIVYFRKEQVRLFSALALSFLFHAGMIFLPVIGGGNALSRGVASYGARNLPTEFSVTLRVSGDDIASDRDPHPETTAIVEDATHLGAQDTAVSRPPDHGAGSSTLPIPGPIYYTTDQLTKPPQAIEMADLDTPEIRPFKVSGRLVLKLWIDNQGRVVDAIVEDSELPKIFSKVAAEAFLHSRFTPGERNGLSVGTLMRVEVGYEDKSLPAKPVPSATEN